MRALVVTLIMFVCIFGGAVAGMLVRDRLPPQHTSRDARKIVKMAMATVATLSALVLGLLVSSAESRFANFDREIRHSCAKLILLDRVLARYGSETLSARDHLRGFLASKLDERWPNEARSAMLPATGDAALLFERAQDQMMALAPANDRQRRLQSRALDLSGDLAQTRWLLVEQSAGSSLPLPFLLVLTFWGTILFTSFGLFAPRNGTVIAALLVSALSVAGGVFLALELGQPFGGVIGISSAPVRNALVQLSH
jgi:hypothetical protein